MRLISPFIIIFLLFCITDTAHADYYLWEDSRSGITLSFPDSWQMGSAIDPSTIIRLKAPAPAEHYTTCRVRTQEDRRYLSYPPINDETVHQVAYGGHYLKSHVETYRESRLLNFGKEAALGNGPASYAVFDYKKHLEEREFIDMRKIVFVSFKYKTVTFFECESNVGEFKKWYPIFLSIAKSIDHPRIHHELSNGNFRFFQGEDIIMDSPARIGTILY